MEALCLATGVPDLCVGLSVSAFPVGPKDSVYTNDPMDQEGGRSVGWLHWAGLAHEKCQCWGGKVGTRLFVVLSPRQIPQRLTISDVQQLNLTYRPVIGSANDTTTHEMRERGEHKSTIEEGTYMNEFAIHIGGGGQK